MSKYLFAPSQFCATVLTYENVSGSVFLTGNLIVDVCTRFSKLAENALHQLNKNDIPEEYLLLTLHRPENVDNPVNLKLLCKHLQSVSYKIVFPIHPRTQQTLAKFNISLPPNIVTIDPVGYIDFLYLLRNCRLVLTDSGGLQEECCRIEKALYNFKTYICKMGNNIAQSKYFIPSRQSGFITRYCGGNARYKN